jgi:hypothetical protein
MSVIIVLSTFLQLSNVKPTQKQQRLPSYFNNNGGNSKGIILILPTKVRDEYSLDQPSLLTWSKLEPATLRGKKARR